MLTDVLLTSAANPRIKSVLALRNRRDREAAGQTRLEGAEELALALRAGVAPVAIFHCPQLMGDRSVGAELVGLARARGARVFECSRAAFEKAAYREGPDGLLAIVPQPGVELAALDVPAGALVLLAQRIEKPGNLGAMLRTADAAGVAAVIAADPVTDWGNPNVIRSSKGTVFSMPVASASTAEAIGWARERGLAVVATTPDAVGRHTDADLTGGIAVAVGSEKYGLDAELFAASTVHVRIPMAGQADSLNASVAAAIVLFEAVRQRG